MSYGSRYFSRVIVEPLKKKCAKKTKARLVNMTSGYVTTQIQTRDAQHLHEFIEPSCSFLRTR